MGVFAGGYLLPSMPMQKSTTISIREERAIISTEDPQNPYLKELHLAAELKDVNGSPLYNKRIIWNASVGEIETIREGLTDSGGESRAIYRPPKVEAETPITITAAFPGDWEYNGCSATIERTILPRLPPHGPPPVPPTVKVPIGVLKVGEEKVIDPTRVADLRVSELKLGEYHKIELLWWDRLYKGLEELTAIVQLVDKDAGEVVRKTVLNWNQASASIENIRPGTYEVYVGYSVKAGETPLKGEVRLHISYERWYEEDRTEAHGLVTVSSEYEISE